MTVMVVFVIETVQEKDVIWLHYGEWYYLRALDVAWPSSSGVVGLIDSGHD